MVNALGVGADDLATDLADNVEDAVIVVQGVFEVLRRIVEFVLVREVSLLELDDSLHEGMPEVILELGSLAIIVGHWVLSYLLFFL